MLDEIEICSRKLLQRIAQISDDGHRFQKDFRQNDRGLAVPRAAVSVFAGITKVFTIEEGVAHERQVTIGTDLGDGWVEVTGVPRGAEVATSGLARLADGSPVSIRTDEKPDV